MFAMMNVAIGCISEDLEEWPFGQAEESLQEKQAGVAN